MTESKRVSADAELLGGMVHSLWAAFPASFQDIIKRMVAEQGLGEVLPDQWYKLQTVMDLLNEVENKFGHHLLAQVGEEAAVRAPIPPQINSIKACLYALNETFSRFHRGGNVGGYAVQEQPNDLATATYLVTASTPYPCALTGGYMAGLARRFKTPEMREILVRHDEGRGCRRQGTATCTYVITCW